MFFALLRAIAARNVNGDSCFFRYARDRNDAIDRDDDSYMIVTRLLESSPRAARQKTPSVDPSRISLFFFLYRYSLYGWRFPLPYCDQKMANVAGVTANHESGSGKNTIRLVKHTAM